MQDVEEECNDVKRANPARGTGSKRSRAAEVHNLSERVSPDDMQTSFFPSYTKFGTLFFSQVDSFLFNFRNSDVEIGSMRRCVLCKNSYQTVIRLAYLYSLAVYLLLDQLRF